MDQGFPFHHFLKNKTNITSTKFTPNKVFEKPSTNSDSFSTDEYELIQKEILDSLKSIISPEKFNAFFENNFYLDSVLLDKISFRVSTPFIKSTIENNYLSSIDTAVESILGKKYDININVGATTSGNSIKPFQPERVIVSSDSSRLSPIKSAKTAKFTLTQNKEDLRLNAESAYIKYMNRPEVHVNHIDITKNFDNFIIGPSNNMAFATAKAVSENPGETGKYPTLYFYSDSGLGKTHLLHAIANEINLRYPNLALCLTTGRDFLKDMIYYIQKKEIHEFQKKYTEKTDVLIIDDIHELSGKEGTQNEFFHIFNELHIKRKQLIFTSDKSPKQIDGLEDRIKTRLQWGLVIDIQRPDLETRIAILKKKANELDLYLKEDIINLIASSIKSSIRELEGSLVRLKAFSDYMKIEIDVEIVKEILKLHKNTDQEKASLDSIAKATSKQTKIPLADLKSKARNKEITRARHVAMYLSQKVLGSTLKEIGKYYGNRDHTTVMHAVEKVKQDLKTDNSLSTDVVAIESQI
ncbi:MAG: chromosomal replication initiator protein DnaA [Bdellovibrionales bacterium RIFOXYA1_FULL_36_14]|nr:MAG: chromosomal replication initiator protein DnaA [Bdellovibrionales bacterium RIFOXYA1_FULL_36_14]